MDISQLLIKLGTILRQSAWGRSLTAPALFEYLRKESDELRSACAIGDKEETAQEAADLLTLALLMLLFLDNNHGVDCEHILQIANRKLQLRYSNLFDDRQLLLPWVPTHEECEMHERQYEERKRIQRILDFSFCPNTSCVQYLHFGAGTLTMRTSGSARAVYCQACGGRYESTEATLFPNQRAPRQNILRIIAEVARGHSPLPLLTQYGHSRRSLERWMRIAAGNTMAITKILTERFEVEEAHVRAHLRQGD